MILRSKELGYPAAALTDHGVTYGLVEFYNAGKKHGVKPIMGCELYVARRTRFDKDVALDRKSYHLTTLAKNNIGYRNLLEMVTRSQLEGFYYKPRVDYDLLKKHSEGLVVLSGCLAAHLPQAILSGDEEEVDAVIKMYLEIFGKENYFLEIQDHPLLEEQVLVNERLKELAKKYDLRLVGTNDSHYPRPEDREVHDILLCIQTQTNVTDENRMRYGGDFSIRDIGAIRKSFIDTPEAVDNTLLVAEMCDVNFDFGTNLIPSFDTPKGKSAKEYLRQLCEEGLKRRFKGETIEQKYWDRLNYELDLVNKMGFDTYFLIVADFVRFAKDQGIAVGPGRGSAAGAIIAWSLGITDVDPIYRGLFFERFLNPERVSMPDIDIDFADHRRDEVLKYVINKYGRDKVSQIITFGTMAPKAAIRDVGRALGYPYAEVDELAKAVPPAVLGKYAPLNKSVVEDRELKKIYDGNERAKKLLDYARKLEGTVRQVGTHACAVVISEKPLTEYTAMQFSASGDGEIVTQYSAGPLESLGLLKMDFLGLRNLTIIEKTLELVEKNTGEKIALENLPLDDTETFELLQRGETIGVFQLESAGMKRYLKELKPTEFEDIVAMGALYRPGPMEWIPTYIKGKHNPEGVEYLDDSFKEILAGTYGVAVYQEQILQLARDFAGFSLGEADLLRKAVGKKIPALLVEQKEKFVQGAIGKGHDKKFASEVFEKVVEPFAGYGFNRAHAVCYGLIAYQTAYLKARYPTEFMTALLYSDSGNTDRIVLDMKECSEMGIDVLPPSVNESEGHFAMVGDKVIRFGLTSIKGVGDGPVGEIVNERNLNGPFKSLDDFAKRVPLKVLNKKVIQSLAYSGALDEFGDRNQISESYGEISSFAKNTQEQADKGQTDIFGMLDIEDGTSSVSLKLGDIPRSTEMQCLKWEKEVLGMYISGHPLKGLTGYLVKRGKLIGNISKAQIGKSIKVTGLVTELRRITTKRGLHMASFVVEDTTGKVGVVLFPREYSKFGADLVEDKGVAVSGKLDYRNGQYQLMVESIKVLSVSSLVQNAKSEGLFDDKDKGALVVRDLNDILGDPDAKEDPASKESDSEVFEINVPVGVTPDKMQRLKEFLVENKGDRPVELMMSSANKKIRLPLGIVDDESVMIEAQKIVS
jgi:DNA polymerase-3 subunit alpha